MLKKDRKQYNKLTPQQKLDRLPINGESKKEIRKLEHLINLVENLMKCKNTFKNSEKEKIANYLEEKGGMTRQKK